MGTKLYFILALILGSVLSFGQTPYIFNTYPIAPSSSSTPGGYEIAWWLCENNGTDESGNGNTLSLYNNAAWSITQAKEGSYSLSLDEVSTNSYASDGTIAHGNSFSISLWFYVPGAWPSNMRGLYAAEDASSDGFRIVLDGYNNWLRVYTDNGTSETTGRGTFLNTNNAAWYHLVVVFNRTAGSLAIYINTSNITSSSSCRTDFKTTNTVVLGNVPYSSGGQLFGYIDGIRVFDIALTPTQISFLYNNPGVGL